MESIDKELCDNVKQLAIDSAKKRVVIDLAKETKYLKEQLEVQKMGVPVFWRNIKDNVKYESINFEIDCPMNRLYDIKLRKIGQTDIIPIGEFFIKHELGQDRRTSKKVEKLIEDYANDLFISKAKEDDEDLLLRDDFERLVEKLRTTYISKNYVGLMSWLIDRAFILTTDWKRKKNVIKRTTDKNKSLLLKTLYEVSPKTLLACFIESHVV